HPELTREPRHIEHDSIDESRRGGDLTHLNVATGDLTTEPHEFRHRGSLTAAEVVYLVPRGRIHSRCDHSCRILNEYVVAHHRTITKNLDRQALLNTVQKNRNDTLALVRMLPRTVRIRNTQRHRIEALG